MATDSLHKSHPLHLPPLLEIKEVIETAMKPQFKELSVEVCDCPDLTQMPWDMASGGLGGETATFHFGGVPYLLPVPDKTKIYDMQEIRNITGIKNPFVLGAGAAYREQVGINSELMANLSMGEVPINKSRASKMQPATGDYKLEMYPSTKTGSIADLFVSEGAPGPVLKIHAKQRIGKDDFITGIRKALTSHYGDKPVGMGGVFQIVNGKARLHIMSDFRDYPLDTMDKINNWLQFFDMKAPLICLSAIVSYDAEEFGIRLEHTHCFSHHGDGGHYHNDTTPEEVEYLGYFNLAKQVFQYDQPPKST